MGTVVEYPTPRSRGVQWTDSTGTALRRPDGSAAEIGIASCTWAELQAEYPNNGAALLALAANTMVFVSDWQAMFVRNAAGTYWVPVGGVCMLNRLVAKVTHTGTVAETAVYTYSIPAGLMTPTSGLRWRVGIKAGANTAGCPVKCKFDSTQLDSNSLAVSGSLTSLTEYQNVGATNVGSYLFNLTYVAATTFDTAPGFSFTVTVTLANAADTAVLHAMYLELC